MAGLVLIKGFSVVAPIKVIKPDSKWGSRKSCFVLSNRWISSSNKTIPPENLASSTTACKSFLLSVAAFNFLKAYLVDPAMAEAIDVFPIPGGPYKIMDDNCMAFTIREMILPSPTRCCWPTTSSIDRGRMRKAKGLFCGIYLAPLLAILALIIT